MTMAVINLDDRPIRSGGRGVESHQRHKIIFKRPQLSCA